MGWAARDRPSSPPPPRSLARRARAARRTAGGRSNHPAGWGAAAGANVAFFLGLAGSSFPVGVGYVSRWTPAARQGSALGVYGLGNIGQSAVVFLGPLLAPIVGIENVFRGLAVALVAWAVAFAAMARDAPVLVPPKGFGAMVAVLRRPLAWVLSLFYFLTFGGFVAFSIYLPTLLRDQFGLRPTDAGFR